MSKNLIIYLAITALFFYSGYYIGNQRGIYKCKNTINILQSVDNRAVASRLKYDVKILTYIRSGDIPNGTELLETIVDLNICDIALLLKTEKDAKYLEAIKMAKQYREKYPSHKPDEKLLESVEEAFQNVSTISQ